MAGVPFSYQDLNLYESARSPSTLHCRNTELSGFFRRYLLQKAISVFDWTLPDWWDKDYFIYCLAMLGYVAVFETRSQGIIPNQCTFSGKLNVYYRPTEVVIANPVLYIPRPLKIGRECSLIKLSPDYGGVCDLVAFYADMMALTAEAAGINIANSKLAYIFAADGKAKAESFKKMTDKILSGEPAVVLDSYLFDDDGSPRWMTFAQNLEQNYIAGEMLQDLSQWESRFNTEIGIPNVNIAKTSGVSAAEVNANNIDTRAKADLWLETLRKGIEQTLDLWPALDGKLAVRKRYDLEIGGEENAGDNIPFRALES